MGSRLVPKSNLTWGVIWGWGVQRWRERWLRLAGPGGRTAGLAREATCDAGHCTLLRLARTRRPPRRPRATSRRQGRRGRGRGGGGNRAAATRRGGDRPGDDEAWGRPAWGRRGGTAGWGRPQGQPRSSAGRGRTQRRTRASEQGRQEEVGAAGRRQSELGGAEGGNLLGGARLVPASINSRH